MNAGENAGLVLVDSRPEDAAPGRSDPRGGRCRRIRTALGDDADVVESVELLRRTTQEELPAAARSRLGIEPEQVNLLLRVTLRPIDRTLTSEHANSIRNTIYRAVHEGPVMELI